MRRDGGLGDLDDADIDEMMMLQSQRQRHSHDRGVPHS
jgi:hypothetical protein